MNKKAFLFFRLIVSAAIIFAIFKFVPYKKLIEVYRDSHKIYLFIGFFIFLFCYLLVVLRWKFLLSSLEIKVSLPEAFCAFFSGLFFNFFFPSFVAGDVFRGFSISYRHGDTKKVISSVLMDRFSGAIAIIFIALLSFILGRRFLKETTVIIPLFILCLIACFCFFVIFRKSFFLFLMKVFKKDSLLKKKLVAFHDELYFFKENPKIFIKSLFFSFPIQFLTATGFFIISKAFGVKIGIIYFLTLVPIIMAITLIPITIAGVGTREASAVYFLSLIGVGKSIGLGISLVHLVFMIFTSVIGGIIYVSIYHRRLQSYS